MNTHSLSVPASITRKNISRARSDLYQPKRVCSQNNKSQVRPPEATHKAIVKIFEMPAYDFLSIHKKSIAIHKNCNAFFLWEYSKISSLELRNPALQ